MSRISRYQESINKYMKSKSCINSLDTEMKKEMLDILVDSDYASSIVLLTVLSSQNRKNTLSLHGYYMGCGIELMMVMCKLIDNKNYYNVSQLTPISNINITLQNKIFHL